MYNNKAIKDVESCPSWSKEHDWKSCKRPKPFRGFESLALRQKEKPPKRVVFSFLFECVKRDSNPLGEAEHNRVFAKRTMGRAHRIPCSPPRNIECYRKVMLYIFLLKRNGIRTRENSMQGVAAADGESLAFFV